MEIKTTVDIGRPVPLHAGASSRAILAFAPPDLRRQVLDGPKTIVDFGERQPGATSVAAPLLAAGGRAYGSTSASGALDRFDEETVRRLKSLVRDAAREVSYGMGGQEKGSQGGMGGHEASGG
jgi:DNA-binding IclR family transcriptional regulator